ncbi:MAG: FAD-dependent oxidoreductase, partial [Chloroflexota bacterium]
MSTTATSTSATAIRAPGHAVVIGASMAGLAGARVLADHFDRVTVIERDRFSETPAFRAGVPQGRHIHVLLASGYRTLERLFPGLDADLAAGGALPLDWAADTRWINFAGWKPRFSSHLRSRACSRELLEWAVRRRVAARPNVYFLPGHEVAGLLASDGGAAVAGVRLRTRPGGPLEPGEDAATASEREAGQE